MKNKKQISYKKKSIKYKDEQYSISEKLKEYYRKKYKL